jgi:hypothetical protein
MFWKQNIFFLPSRRWIKSRTPVILGMPWFKDPWDPAWAKHCSNVVSSFQLQTLKLTVARFQHSEYKQWKGLKVSEDSMMQLITFRTLFIILFLLQWSSRKQRLLAHVSHLPPLPVMLFSFILPTVLTWLQVIYTCYNMQVCRNLSHYMTSACIMVGIL